MSQERLRLGVLARRVTQSAPWVSTFLQHDGDQASFQDDAGVYFFLGNLSPDNVFSVVGRDTSAILWLHRPRRLLWPARTPCPSKRTSQDRARQQHFVLQALLDRRDSSRGHTRRRSWTMSRAIAGHPSTSTTLLPKAPLHELDSCSPPADHISLYKAHERSLRLLSKPLHVLKKSRRALEAAPLRLPDCSPRTRLVPSPDNSGRSSSY